MVFAARNGVRNGLGVAFALLGARATTAVGSAPAPAYAASTLPAVPLTGWSAHCADQVGWPTVLTKRSRRRLPSPRQTRNPRRFT